MRVLVLGAGLQGSACAYDLLQDPAIAEVTLADIDPALPRFLRRYRSDPRLRLVQLDARDEDAVRAQMAGAAACTNALPYYFNLAMARLAVDAGAHYADLGGNTAIVREQLALDPVARGRGISVIPDCGLAPGMVNILAQAGIDALDRTESVRIRVGGLPQNPEPPLHYQVVYSLHGVLDYYTTPSWVLRDGEPLQVEALSEVEPVEFQQPVGTLEAFHTAGGLSTMADTYRGRIPSMEYKTLRYPGHADTMRAIRQLGLIDVEPVLVGEQSVRPRDVFIACAGPRLTRPDAPDLVALQVVAEGTRDGVPARVAFDLLDYMDRDTGISAMERTTGFSLAITALMQMRGELSQAGAHTPDQAVPAAPYIAALARRGVHIRRSG